MYLQVRYQKNFQVAGKKLKKPAPKGWLLKVWVAGFEPTTSCTPCKRATGLRYTQRNRRALSGRILWHAAC